MKKKNNSLREELNNRVVELNHVRELMEKAMKIDEMLELHPMQSHTERMTDGEPTFRMNGTNTRESSLVERQKKRYMTS